MFLYLTLTSCVANMDLLDGGTLAGGIILFTVTYNVDGYGMR